MYLIARTQTVIIRESDTHHQLKTYKNIIIINIPTQCVSNTEYFNPITKD